MACELTKSQIEKINSDLQQAYAALKRVAQTAFDHDGTPRFLDTVRALDLVNDIANSYENLEGVDE